MSIQAGYGERVITPPLGIDLTGYGYYLDRKGESVLDDLKARAVFLQKDGASLILVSCDLIGFSVAFSDQIRQALASRFNVSAERILLTCTHTHTGPASMRLRGLGRMDLQYMETLPGLIQEACEDALSDLSEAKCTHHREVMEPIGFNRRKGWFAPVDPFLSIVRFEREEQDVFLLGYGCHPVMLGRIAGISADWPGGVVRQMDRRGIHAVVFQGFLGDIDPTTNRNRWGGASVLDLDLYGEMIAARALKVAKYGVEASDELPLNAIESRIPIPLVIPSSEKEIENEKDALVTAHGNWADADKFYSGWVEEALNRFPAYRKEPFLKNVPFQAISICGLKMIGIPGEVFCEYGLNLASKFPGLFPVGLAGGDIGYVPTKEAYQTPGDYACYGVAKFYDDVSFPFSDEIESIIMTECESLLNRV